jgi:hypothetical protein
MFVSNERKILLIHSIQRRSIMLDSKGFDNWAGDYDEIIGNSKGYPGRVMMNPGGL